LRYRGREEWRSDEIRPDAHDAGDQPAQSCGIRSETEKPALGKTKASDGPMSWRGRANRGGQSPNWIKHGTSQPGDARIGPPLTRQTRNKRNSVTVTDGRNRNDRR
jgi:hypothetical protein